MWFRFLMTMSAMLLVLAALMPAAAAAAPIATSSDQMQLPETHAADAQSDLGNQAPGVLADACVGDYAEEPDACVQSILAYLLTWGLKDLANGTLKFQSAYDERVHWFQTFITNASKDSPTLNTLAIATYHNVPHAGSGVGQVIGACGHSHQEFSVDFDFADTQGVEIYTVGQNGNCCVEKWGDGGWTNWGYYGSWTQATTSSGSLMMCIPVDHPEQNPAGYDLTDLATSFVLDSNASKSGYTNDFNGGPYQLWKFEATGQGSYVIRDAATGFVLDSNASGNVYTNDFNGGPYQQWKLQPSDVDGYSYIVDVATGRYLDSNANKNVYTSDFNGGPYQKWHV